MKDFNIKSVHSSVSGGINFDFDDSEIKMKLDKLE